MAGLRQFLCRLYRFSKSGPRPSPLLLPLALQLERSRFQHGGSAIAVDGTLVPLDSSEVIIGTSTLPLGPAAQTVAGALGSLIVYGIGAATSPASGPSNGTVVTPFIVESGKLQVGIGTVVFALIVSPGAGTLALELL